MKKIIILALLLSTTNTFAEIASGDEEYIEIGRCKITNSSDATINQNGKIIKL
jgi:hypothetical protein